MKTQQVRACGVLIVRGDPIQSFLLMRHPDRWDLPKGHVDPGETNYECALRELEEETGITGDDIELDDRFEWRTEYDVVHRRYGAAHKTLIIYLARLVNDVPIVPTEHAGFEWFDWSPPHKIQEKSINPMLRHVEEYLKNKSG